MPSSVLNLSQKRRKERKGSARYETAQRKRYGNAVRPDPGAGDFGDGGFDDVPVTIGDLGQHELPDDDPDALWRGGRDTRGGQLPALQLCSAASHCERSTCATASTRRV